MAHVATIADAPVAIQTPESFVTIAQTARNNVTSPEVVARKTAWLLSMPHCAGSGVLLAPQAVVCGVWVSWFVVRVGRLRVG